jgi:hypothetical protein
MEFVAETPYRFRIDQRGEGAYQLAEAVDGLRGGTSADIVIHGHSGSEWDCTAE